MNFYEGVAHPVTDNSTEYKILQNHNYTQNLNCEILIP